MEQAADACRFIKRVRKGGFIAGKRTQQAVIMNFVIIGEAATKLMDGYPEFVELHQEFPWLSMRGMRSRIAMGFGINLKDSQKSSREGRKLSSRWVIIR